MAAIRLARSGITVTMVDRGRRAGAVTEVLSPNAQKILRAAGLWGRVPKEALAPCHAILSAWGAERLATTSFVRHPYGSAARVDRERFDEWLRLEARDAGASVVADKVLRAQRKANGWNVALRGQPDALTADIIVVATGRSGFRLPEMGHRFRLDRLVMFGGVFEAKMPTDTALLVESTSSGWWYSVLTTRSLMFAGWITDARCVEGTCWREGLFKELSATRFTQQRVASVQSVLCSAVASSYSPRCSGPSWFAIGDAALARDPLSGEGVTQALSSGWEVAGRIVSVLDGSPSGSPDRCSAHEDAIREYATASTEMYRRERRWPDSGFWNLRFGRQVT